MGIFGKLFGGNTTQQEVSTPAPANIPTPVQSSSIDATTGLLNLNKGDILDLTKYSDSLTKVRAAAGWKVNAMGRDYDLDLCAYMLINGEVDSTVYYRDRNHRGIFLDGDNLTGSTGNNDDENIHVNLQELHPAVDEIVFAVVIYSAAERHQKFSNVKNAYMRLVDESNGKEICRYNLSEDGGDNTAVKLASLKKNANGNWSFHAIGEYSKNTIESLRRTL